jgi:hypothetical protein
MVKHKKTLVSALAVLASVITYVGWTVNKRRKKKKEQLQESGR